MTLSYVWTRISKPWSRRQNSRDRSGDDPKCLACRQGRRRARGAGWLARLFDAPLRGVQRISGYGGMAAFFLAPNMLVFGIFVLFPLVLNIVYSTTGGSALFLADRSFVGLAQYQRLFDCSNFLDPKSCSEDLFWTAVWNTATFVVVQVVLMVAVALVTALVLNRDLRARSFWRAVFFFPVLLSPVVVGLIWRWISCGRGAISPAILPLDATSMRPGMVR